MLEKTKRYFVISKVFFKYNLFSLLYKDIHRDYISNKQCTCALDLEDRSHAVKLKLAFEELGPSFIKLGQMLSKRSDLLPPTYIMELENLQDKVNPINFDKMRESFETDCICSISENRHAHHPTCYHCNDILEMFEEFDTTPIASASIGQVYQGVLNGKKVAVKIARPNLLDTINLDLEIINDIKPILIKVLGVGKNFNVDSFLHEYKQMLHKELDYRFEAINMQRLKENFQGFEGVEIPGAYMDYCRENVLVMDFVEGTQIKDLVDIEQKLKSRYAHLIGSSYLKQVYLDGFYHADPHSGNIIALDDSIAFIDFGAVGIINKELKWSMLSFFYATYKKNTEMATDVLLKMSGLSEEDVDIHNLRQDIDDLIADQYYGPEGRKSDKYAMLALKYDMSLPPEFSTLERAILIIEAVCLKLDPNYNIISEAKPIISEAMKDHYSPKKLAEGAQFEADEYMDIFKNLPAGIDDVIRTIRGYRIEKLQGKDGIAKKYHLLDEMSRNIFFGIILITSAYLIINGGEHFTLLGIAGFASGLLMGMYSLMRH
ncbi:ubiquinone biosynthesis protein [Methanohalophilus levihalophilus]|uniref:ABC1 kinase family protein n=1 Tax=Methanohalophilus levihalophilus TaxID=1431282 RepID=UPI001AE14C15|nr:lipopolysaccharide core heptose(II) kinase RfaY [Methanohalophilus levihalophilus]MBP2030803.1 ubiquinone biosynthesis protein [Methanohalophilus levihalophilus]